MWYIAGTLPGPDPVFREAAAQGPARMCDGWLHLADGSAFPVQRGTEALAATALLACEALGFQPPRLLLAGDTGSGEGSRALYAWLTEHADTLNPEGMTFHYLFPDVDWHNRVLMALQALPTPPVLVADAGFMYVAKMSGYADAYDLFTPDIGEMAFLADEKAPHPFYTRGFLLAEEENVAALLERANAHGNCPAHLIIKGRIDHIVCGGRLTGTVKEPSVAAMECIGGTGDLVTGLVTALLAGGIPMCRASLAAARIARLLAEHCAPDPGTQVGALLQGLPHVLHNYAEEVLRQS
ncbi:NAD(P)H-hydrate dehydratase [Desulfovibrio sp.]|uniref:NAD(P)H-hydrate dehydratase n=1 Tax=Desulfovibrio sp. TaxID=885 RepID=UPI0025B8722E|nr:NAD(P)H-hydrate dehydratase [Desulfovibrio sp.]